MSDTHTTTTEPTPHDKFVKGLRAVFGTSKAESDRQLAEDAELRRQKQPAKTAKKKAAS